MNVTEPCTGCVTTLATLRTPPASDRSFPSTFGGLQGAPYVHVAESSEASGPPGEGIVIRTNAEAVLLMTRSMMV